MTQGAKEVKISFESFLHKEIQDALYWNKEIGSKIMFGSKTGKYFCKECNFWDNQKANIVNHVELKHLAGFPGYTCVLCHYVFQTWFIFKSHVKKNHCAGPADTRKSVQMLRERNSKVPQANIQKNLKSELLDHEELTNSNQRLRGVNKMEISKKDSQPKPPKPKPLKKEVVSFYACGKCDAKYTQRNQLYLHYKVAHHILPAVDEMSFEIPVYDEDRKPKISNDQSILTSESRLGVSQNPKRVKTEITPCTYCPKYFTSFSEYAEHEATHAGVFIYNCHLCKCLGFRTEQIFIEHMTTKHKIDITSNLIKMIQCSYTETCQRLFLSKQIMQTHILNDHFKVKTKKTIYEARSNQPPLFKPLENLNKSLNFNPSKPDEDLSSNFSISLPTIPVIPDKDDRFKISSNVSESDLGFLDVKGTSVKENSSCESSIKPLSKIFLSQKVDMSKGINQMETLLESESSIAAHEINAPEPFGDGEDYCVNDNNDHDQFEPHDPLAIEPGEIVDDTEKSETFLEEAVVMC